MPKYNFYKIFKDNQNKLEEKLKSVGLERIKSIVENEFTYDFYYPNEIKPLNIWWVELYKDFLEDINVPNNIIYFGALLIYNTDIVYAISLGKSYFYLSEYCDNDFGLKLAERIINPKSIKIKNSHYFGIETNKILRTYQRSNKIQYDAGESLQLLKAEPVDKEKWGKTISFGHSVLLSIKEKPLELKNVINEIEQILLKDPIVQIPKVERILNKDKIAELDEKLCDSILINEGDVAVEELSIVGVDFIFTHNSSYIYRCKGYNAYHVNELNVDNLSQYIKEKNINIYVNINNIKVEVKDENTKPYTKSLKNFLDYVGNDNCCLINGQWYLFNQSYIDYLVNSVDKLNFECNEEENLSIADYKSYLINNGLDEKKMYKEKYFNIIAEDRGYMNYDRELDRIAERFKIEKMDLFKDDTLYFVKIGNPQKLAYVVDQSINTMQIIRDNNGLIYIDEKPIEPKRICLWLILKRKEPINKLTDLNSMIFLMKLNEWNERVENMGLEALIKVNYIQ